MSENLELRNQAVGDQPVQKYGLEALTEDERAILDWDEAEELTAFQRANPNVSENTLKNKILFFRNQVGTHELFDAFRLDLPDPYLSWEKIRDIYLSDASPENSHAARHDLDEVSYPPGYVKAWIENVRQEYLNYIASRS